VTKNSRATPLPHDYRCNWDHGQCIGGPIYKGGGRESGRDSNETEVRQAELGGTSVPAANPVACSFCGILHREGYFPKRRQVAAHAKRIRELETSRREDVARAGRFMAERDALKARVAELEKGGEGGE